MGAGETNPNIGLNFYILNSKSETAWYIDGAIQKIDVDLFNTIFFTLGFRIKKNTF